MSERTTDYIERLQLKLHEARGLVMSLIEDKAREILETSETFSSLYAWRKTVTARIVDIAEPVQFHDGAQQCARYLRTVGDRSYDVPPKVVDHVVRCFGILQVGTVKKYTTCPGGVD